MVSAKMRADLREIKLWNNEITCHFSTTRSAPCRFPGGTIKDMFSKIGIALDDLGDLKNLKTLSIVCLEMHGGTSAATGAPPKS